MSTAASSGRSWPDVGRIAAALILVAAVSPLRADDGDSFRAKVAPILEARCLRCHGETARKGASRW